MNKPTALLTALLLSSAALAQNHPRAGQMLDRMDANNDGSVTQEEFTAARAEMFSKRDRNTDGYLDGEDAGKRMKHRGGEHMAEARDRLDKDGDGRISKDEFVNADSPLFATADKDSNGVLDAHELANAKTAMQERMKEHRAQ